MVAPLLVERYYENEHHGFRGVLTSKDFSWKVVPLVILNFILRWAIVGLFARLVFHTKVVGRKNLPKGGFVLAVGPHKTAKETIIVPGHLPQREFHIMIKEGLWKGVVGWAFRTARQIKVERFNGRGHESLAPAIADVKNGFLLMIFPEGTRHEEDDYVHVGKPGAMHIALSAGVMVVPVGLVGMVSKNGEHRKQRKLVIGEPYDPALLLNAAERQLMKVRFDRTAAHRLTPDLMRRIAELGETQYRD